jgi:membrane dipeptidase
MAQDDASEDRARRVLREAIVIDGHGHTLDAAYEARKRLHHPLPGMTDVPRMRAGEVTAQISACYVADVRTEGSGPNGRYRPLDTVLQMLDFFHGELEAGAGEYVALGATAEEVEVAKKEGKCVLILGLEGADPLNADEDLETLRVLHQLGLRHTLIAHEGRNAFGTSSAFWTGTEWREYDPELDGPGGLTPRGKELVQELNRLGILVDVSHLAEASFWDVLEVGRGPVVATHSNARALSDCQRNLTDEQIAAIAETGGVVGATAMRLCPDEKSDLGTCLDQIDYLVGLVGAVHVGFGTDFGREGYGPPGLEDIGKIGNLARGLLVRGYGAEDVQGILGGNLFRVFKAAAEPKP